MLLNVLTRLAADTGYEPTQQRSLLVNLLNNAARDLYNALECTKVYRETTLTVPPDAVVSLPSFIGELRGMRMHTNELPFDVNSIGMPRYITNTLQYKFKNWRDLGEVRIHSLPTTVGPLTLTTNAPADNASVLISGQTNNAQRIEEVVTVNAASVTTTNMFTQEIGKIACMTERTSDITILDANGNELAVLYNNDLQTRYKLVDVSQVFWTLDTSDGQSLIDVMYKVPLTRLTKDSDSFPGGDDYDNAWYFQAYFLYLKTLQGREDEAQAAKQNALSAIISAKDGSEQSVMKKMIFGRNKFYGIFRKYRYYPGSVTNVDNNIQP